MNSLPPPSRNSADDELDRRLNANWAVVLGEVVAPRPSRFERALRRIGIPERAARLAAATPALRWAWLVSTVVVLVFAVAAGNADGGTATAQDLAVLLAIAPLVPIVAVAMSYGAAADPAHEVYLVAPLGGWRVLLIRTATVLSVSFGLTTMVALLSPAAGWWRMAWLLPGLACTGTVLALSTRLTPRLSALLVGCVWLTVVISVGQVGTALSPYNLIGQVVALGITIAAAVFVGLQRRLFSVTGHR